MDRPDGNEFGVTIVYVGDVSTLTEFGARVEVAPTCVCDDTRGN